MSRDDDWRAEAEWVRARTRPARWDPEVQQEIDALIDRFAAEHEQRVADATVQLARLAHRLARAVIDGRMTRHEAALRLRAAAERPDPDCPVFRWLVPARVSAQVARAMRQMIEEGAQRGGHHRHRLRQRA